MAKGFNFRDVLDELTTAIDRRTIKHPKKVQMKKYKAGPGTLYNPVFSLIIREGRALCVWCGNRIKPNKKKGIVGEFQFGRIQESQIQKGFTSEEWDALGVAYLEGI